MLTFESSDYDFRDLLDELFHMNEIFFEKKKTKWHVLFQSLINKFAMWKNSGCIKLPQAIFFFSLLSCYCAVLLSGRRIISLVFQQRVIRQSSSGFGCHGFGQQPQPPTDNRSQLFSDKNSVFRKFDEGKKALESFCRKAKYNYNESLAEKLATAENEMENVKESVV